MKLDVLYVVLLALIPGILVLVVAVFFLNKYVENEEKRRRYLLFSENQKQLLPLRLQAYERLVLFSERISPENLLQRISPIDENIKNYESLLVQTIDQEFIHNLTQQIYVSQSCWRNIKACKNEIIALIRKSAMVTKDATAQEFRTLLLKKSLEDGSPSQLVLQQIRKEVSDFLI